MRGCENSAYRCIHSRGSIFFVLADCPASRMVENFPASVLGEQE
jgi:hypothetical protein